MEQTFSMPFDVRKSMVDGEEQYVCNPLNSGDLFFSVEVYVHNQIRLVVDVQPQKNAMGLLNEIAHADEYKKKMFFQYLDILKSENAKVKLLVNDEPLTDCNHWPRVWRFFSCKMSLLPIPELSDEEELLSLLSLWMIHGTTLFFTLLTIEDIEDFTGIALQLEGRGKEIRSIKYERNRINRSICLAHKGYSCAVCGFNFLQQYGIIGKEFIEVHHTTPVSKMGDDYVLDIDRDLVPVCSNCHSMIHRKDPPITIEELKAKIINGRRENESNNIRTREKRAFEHQLIPQGSLLESVEHDVEVRKLIHNMMELYESTSILKISSECQKEFQIKYFSMKTNDWRHLIANYVRKVTDKQDLQEDEVFSFNLTG